MQHLDCGGVDHGAVGGSGRVLGEGAGASVAVASRVAGMWQFTGYDRAGLGGSTDDRSPRSLERLAVDLAAVVDWIEPSSPVVLVGSSLGGPIIRLFAATRASRVAGLVFVDGAVADATPNWHTRRLRRGFTLAAALSRTGLHKPLIMAAMKSAIASPMPPEHEQS